MDIGYTKTEARNIKKLDDRTRILAHLGIKPDSKAYRMFDPASRKIIVSRDVVFEDDRRWKWRNLLDHKTVEKLRQLKVTFSVYGNQGIKDNIKEPEADNTKMKKERIKNPMTIYSPYGMHQISD